jgi:molecular chaperone DnaK (HSP70)
MTLIIDIGTVNTVAMVDGRLVTVDGAPWLPSAVFAGPSGYVVGADALLLGRGRVERDLTPAALRALCERVVSAARAQGGGADDLVLTHPAGWGPDRVGLLIDAARGLVASARTVAAPLAVAAGQGLAAGETALVVDAGGGTCEVAVVRREPDGHVLVAHESLPLGGNDLDQRVVARVLPSLRSPTDAGAALTESARAGKEVLSRHQTAEIVLPDHRAVRLDRQEFERLVAADVEQLAGVVARAAAMAVSRVVLAGGTSRVPLVVRRVAEVTGRAVVVDPEPETAVVRGAHVLTRRAAGYPQLLQ